MDHCQFYPQFLENTRLTEFVSAGACTTNISQWFAPATHLHILFSCISCHLWCYNNGSWKNEGKICQFLCNLPTNFIINSHIESLSGHLKLSCLFICCSIHKFSGFLPSFNSGMLTGLDGVLLCCTIIVCWHDLDLTIFYLLHEDPRMEGMGNGNCSR